MIQTQPIPHRENQPPLEDAYDVIVIGGGPAGATYAAIVAQAGFSVLICDRAEIPRFHVGESLIPETYWTLERLGLVPWLNESAYPRKYSVQFITETGKESAPFYFDEYKDCPSSMTWQVIRGEFDEKMLETASQNGAVLRTDAHVMDVLIEDGRAVGVKVKLKTEGTVREIRSRVVGDASGQTAFLANRLKLREPDPHLKHGTVWSYFRGALRDPGRDEGATIILQTPEKKSWFWYIPLPHDLVSVGCTGELKYMFGERISPEQIFEREVARCPGIQRRINGAERATEFFTTRDFSYYSSKSAGDGWVLLGDANGFIDPVYSTGVFLALKSGEMAADATAAALADDEPSAERLGTWSAQYREGVDLFRKLVYAFYTPGFSFGSFLKEHPQYRNNLVDMLIGDVFKPGVGDMFDAISNCSYVAMLDAGPVVEAQQRRGIGGDLRNSGPVGTFFSGDRNAP